jgi:hypothetical protein
MVHHHFVASLHRDLWSYASMMLSGEARSRLEEACRKLGVPISHNAPPGPIAPAAFCSVLKAAYAQEGAAFVHHAAFLAGGNAARRAEGNLLNPNTGAQRLVAEAAAAFPSLNLESKAASPARFEVSIVSRTPVESYQSAYAHGFAKGAAQRLNEGARPQVRESSREGGRVWTVSIEWAQGDPGELAVRGAGKTRRR